MPPSNRTLFSKLSLKPLLHPASNSPQVAVYFAGVLSEDQTDNGLACNVDVLEAAEDVDLLVCENDWCLLETRMNAS